jgi:peroxin-11C
VPIIAARGAHHNETKEKLEKLASNMSLTRKVLRFGKPIPLVKNIIDRYADHQKKPVKNFALRTFSDIFLSLYFLTDHPLYFQRIGFVKMDKVLVDKIDYWNNIFWLLNAVLDIIADYFDLVYILDEINKLVKFLAYVSRRRTSQEWEKRRDLPKMCS